LLKVVLIDDEYFFRNSLKNNIEWEKYCFTIVGDVNNGKSGYELILSEKPDIALVDIMMPGMTGIELIKAVRDANITSRFIILSGYDEFKYAQQAISMGVSDYILKPIDFDILLSTLLKVKKEILSQKRHLEENENLKKQNKNFISKEFNTLSNISFDSDKIESKYKSSEVSDRVEEFIRLNFSRTDLSVHTISNQLFLNYSYICTCFKRDKNITIGDFIINTRISKSIEMFRNGHINISTVSSLVGYESPNYFSKCFKKIVGVSPSDYINLSFAQSREGRVT